MRRSAILSSIVVASLVLVGCSSGGTPTASTSAASSSSGSESSGAATTTVGGDTTSLDEQTTTWFETLCTGLAGLGELTSGNLDIASPQQAGTVLTTVGDTFTQTGEDLGTLPPPTFDGGEQVAAELQGAMKQAGQIFVEYGQRASTIAANDQAAGEKFATDFQTELSKLEIANFKPTPAVQEAVQAIPSCAPIFGAS